MRASQSDSRWLAFGPALFIAVVVAIGFGACRERSIQVLEPAASNAPVASNGPPSVAPNCDAGTCEQPEPPPCPMADGKPCSRQVGEICRNADECCTRACTSQPDGTLRCTAAVACRSGCEICGRPTDCCSGSCTPDAEGVNRCSSGTCLAEGEVCAKNEDCCSTVLEQQCVEEPAGQKVKRCRRRVPPAECLANDAACALSSTCCSGICAPGKDLVLHCAMACADDGQPCAIRSDCCSPNSDCATLDGGRICQAMTLL